MRSRIPPALPVLLASCVFAAAVAAAQQEAARPSAPLWDQEKVSALAGGVVEALDALLADPQVNAQQATAMQQREHEAAVATARQLRDLAEDYKKRVDAGYDQEETQAFWAQMMLLRGDIQAYASRSWLPEATRAKADRAVRLLDQLGRYYPEV